MQRFHDFIFAHVPQHQPCPPERRQEIHQTRPRRQPQRSCDRPSRGRLRVCFEKESLCLCVSFYLSLSFLHLSFFVFVFLCPCPPACWVQPCLVLIFLIVFVFLFSCLSLSLPTCMLGPTMSCLNLSHCLCLSVFLSFSVFAHLHAGSNHGSRVEAAEVDRWREANVLARGCGTSGKLDPVLVSCKCKCKCKLKLLRFDVGK